MPEPAGLTSGPTTPERESAPEEDPAPRTLPEHGALHIRVRRGAQPVMGRATWLTVTNLADAMARLSPTTLPGQEDDPRARNTAFAGDFEVAVPEGHATWLRITETRGATVFERVPPFRERLDLDLDLTADGAVLHLQVLQADGCKAAARAEVLARHIDLDNGQRRELGPFQVDAEGYLRLSVAPGGWLLRTRRAAWEDRAPRTCAAVIAPGGPQHIPAVLLEPEATADVTLMVEVDGRPEGPVAPKLVFRRMDRGGDEPWPQPGVLRAGRQEVRLQLPLGDYECTILPQRALHLAGDAVLHVGLDPVHHVLRLEQPGRGTRLRILGIGREQFPIRVYLAAADGLRRDAPEHDFVGPNHWHAAEETVPGHPDPVLVVVAGGHGMFVSTNPVVVDGAPAEVEVVPATWLTVAWSGTQGGDAPAMSVWVRSGSGEWARSLGLRAEATTAAPRLVLAGDLVVPLGALEVRGHVAGRTPWHVIGHARLRRSRVDVSPAGATLR